MNVKHRGPKATYEAQDNDAVPRKDLRPLLFDDLNENEKTWLLERLCVALRGLIESALKSIALSDMASFATVTSESVSDAGAAATQLFRKGEALKVVARNAAILAAFRAHRALEPGRDSVKRFTEALVNIAKTFAVDLTAESLKRYIKVGELFDRCSGLLFCDCLKALMDHSAVVGHMLDQAPLIGQLTGLWEQRESQALGDVAVVVLHHCIDASVGMGQRRHLAVV